MKSEGTPALTLLFGVVCLSIGIGSYIFKLPFFLVGLTAVGLVMTLVGGVGLLEQLFGSLSSNRGVARREKELLRRIELSESSGQPLNLDDLEPPR